MRRRWSRLVCLILVTLLFISVFPKTAQAQWDVKVSSVDYFVEMENAFDVFICNEQTIGSKPGTEYYMTYTVESIDTVVRQQGVIGAADRKKRYPYEDGGVLEYNLRENKMLIEGYTYFIKFVVTEEGYDYKIAWAEHKEDQSRYFDFNYTYQEGSSTNLQYFGIALMDKEMTGRLAKVRFYDKYGNDLGVQVAPGCNASVGRENPLPADSDVEHTYQITVTDGVNVAISNQRMATGNKVYMEYTVKSTDTHIYQTGGILSNAPKAGYPYNSGLFVYQQYEYNPDTAGNGALLTPGAKYLVMFEKVADGLEFSAQMTLNGKSTIISFPLNYGTFYEDAEYYSLWFGENKPFPVNFVLTDFKCYDENKNNLGVQSNSQRCEIIHYGELEDYSGCEAVYYCEADETLYALYDDKALLYTEGDKTQVGEYKVQDGVITLDVMGQSSQYDYLYHYFRNKEGKMYKRLHTYRVIFETGNESKVKQQTLSPENGYMVMRPTDPTCEGNTFLGWYTLDGKAYEFGQVEAKSLTLYAKWENTEYLNGMAESHTDVTSYMVVVASVLILCAAVVVSVMIVKRGKRIEKETN